MDKLLTWAARAKIRQKWPSNYNTSAKYMYGHGHALQYATTRLYSNKSMMDGEIPENINYFTPKACTV